MAIVKTIKVDDTEVKFRASAALPRIYRLKFKRDMMADMEKLQSAKSGINSLETLENVAYIMAYNAAKVDGAPFPESVDDWLDQFNMLSIYGILPEIVEMWGLNMETMITPKKK